MKSILDYFPTAAFEQIGNDLLKNWERCLVSFHAKKQYADNHVLTIGTGFVVNIQGHLAIATASHVITEYNRGNGIGVMLGGKYASLDGAKVLHQATQDIAFIKMPEALAGMVTWPLVMGKREDTIPTCSFMIFGFPETKNRIDIRKKEIQFSVVNVMAHSFEYEKTTGDLLFPYNPKHAYVEPGSAVNAAVSLRGLSGGPVAQLLLAPDTHRIALRPVGVFKEWRQHAIKKLVACSFTDFSDELDASEQQGSSGTSASAT
jgi:hypothetical protein